MQKEKLTGYPSIDKPWLKYYTQEATIKVNPNCGMYRFMRERNANGLQNIALNYFGRKVTYGEMFERIDAVARALHSIGVKKGDIVTVCPLNTFGSTTRSDHTRRLTIKRRTLSFMRHSAIQQPSPPALTVPRWPVDLMAAWVRRSQDNRSRPRREPL
ncbi:MAG: hypothetical protein II038_17245 [Lachnospiraceae bacterium]|jgi:acyl-CoA synthetase (AMP-forming)/AMP-acid ligase II|nr:hypothetical protein [Lachnospiraceae bacterium]MBQ2220481.1 hypothetical protein [Acidaminococcaceae bacterium]